jgi:hypothetical protein
MKSPVVTLPGAVIDLNSLTFNDRLTYVAISRVTKDFCMVKYTYLLIN